MTTTDIEKAAVQLLKQYRDIPSLDKSRAMLVAKYGESDFVRIRQAVAVLWLQKEQGVHPVKEKPLVADDGVLPAKKKPSKKNKSSRQKQGGGRIQYGLKSIEIGGTPISPNASDKDIAHLILLTYGTPKAISGHYGELSRKLTKLRFKNILPLIDELYASDKKTYQDIYEKKMAALKEARKKYKKLAVSSVVAKEKETVREQNERWARLREGKRPRGENYFKLIYIPMGNKR